MGKTLKVRIPAVISPDGRWCAQGFQTDGEPDWGFMMECADGEGDPLSNYQHIWITVELPIPEDAEVTGTVEASE